MLTGLALVVISQALLAVAAETTRPELRDPEYGTRLRTLRARLAVSPGRPLVLLLGSSRTEMGFSPAAVPVGTLPGDPVVFNFGLPGSGPLHELLLLERLLAAGVRPAAIFAEVLPPVLNADGPAEGLFAGERLTWRDLRTLRPYFTDPRAADGQWLRGRLTPLMTARFYLMSRAVPNWLPHTCRLDYLWNGIDADGWMKYPRDAVPAQKRAEGTVRAAGEYVPRLANFHVSPVPDRALRALAERCRAEGIGLHLHLMPEGPTFRSWYPPPARAAVRDYLAAVSREYGVGVTDAREWLDGDEWFADSHHLLPAGAQRFSERFAREVMAAANGRRAE